jgi:hypothetical protein
MRTERQIKASRANGARSRGPVTAEGKYSSSRNAIKHGLLAETIVLKTEPSDRFLEILAELEEELQPETSIEYTLIEKMAAARWRQLRLWGMEKAAMEYQTRQQADSVGRGEDIPTRALDLIISYDSLCDRQFLRTHKRFLELRRGRGESSAPSKPQPQVMPQPEASLEDPIPAPVCEPFMPELPGQSDEIQPNDPTTYWKQSNRPARTRRNPGKRMKSGVILTSGSRLP